MEINPLSVAADADIEELDSPFWMTDPCPEWCWQHHSQHDYGSDRDHMSKWSHHMWLTLEEPTRHDLRDSDLGIQHSACTLVTYLMQGYREVEPHIAIEEEHRRFAMNLTLAEARQLAAVLNHALALADSDTASEVPAPVQLYTPDAEAA